MRVLSLCGIDSELQYVYTILQLAWMMIFCYTYTYR